MNQIAVLAVLFLIASALPAQKVAIHPRNHAGPASDSSKPFKSEARLVLIPVSVTDRNGATVRDLSASDFSVFEGGVRRPIISFSREDAPCSTGIVLDTSGSMKNKIGQSRVAVRAFVDSANPLDETFLMTFAGRPLLRVAFTTREDDVRSRLFAENAEGSTALLDAIHKALRQVKSARNSRRALLVLSDGGDNDSRFSKGEVMRAALEGGVQICSIGMPEYPRNLIERSQEANGLDALRELAERTGGRQIIIRDMGRLGAAVAKIGAYLRYQYVIGINVPEAAPAGKWQSLQVKVNMPENSNSLHVDARTRYYVPD